MASLPRFIYIILACSFLFSCKSNNFEYIEEFRGLKVGNLLPHYTGLSKQGIHIGNNTPEGNFFVHVITHEISETCLDLECDNIAKLVLEKGGHLIVSNDAKLAQKFGIRLISNGQLKFDTSLMILSDKEGIILSMYKNVKITDVKKIISDFDKLRD